MIAHARYLKYGAILLTALLLFISNHSAAQSNITGKLMNAKNQPVSFASVIYLHHLQGGITDSAGNFQIPFIKNDSVQFSAVGYLTKTIFFSSATDTVVRLEENQKNLSNITITGTEKFHHKKYIGYYKHKNDYSAFLIPQMQVATFISNENQNRGIIKNVRFKLIKTPHNEFYLRIRFFNPDSSGSPDKILPYGDTIISPKLLSRKNTIDFSKRKILFPKNGIFVSFEWLSSDHIASKNPPPGLSGNATDVKSDFTYYNYNDGKWYADKSESGISEKKGVLNVEIQIAY
jgi:hypothetical protein